MQGQIRHLARLLATQMTAEGKGPGIEHVEKIEEEKQLAKLAAEQAKIQVGYGIVFVTVMKRQIHPPPWGWGFFKFIIRILKRIALCLLKTICSEILLFLNYDTKCAKLWRSFQYVEDVGQMGSEPVMFSIPRF